MDLMIRMERNVDVILERDGKVLTAAKKIGSHFL